MILETSRLRMRPMRSTDAGDLHQVMGDAEVMAFWDISQVETLELTTAILEEQLAAEAANKAVSWAMELGKTGAFIGACELSEIDHRHKRAEVGFIIARSYWAGGYTQEALSAVIDHAAQTLRLQRLTALTHLSNVRSVRLLERLGFSREGLLRGYVDRDGQRRDCLMFGLLL